eukprot:163530_1
MSDSDASEDSTESDANENTEQPPVTMEWMKQNEHNKIFWKNVRISRSTYDYREFKKKYSMNKMPKFIAQKDRLTINKTRIREIYANHILSSEGILKAIHDSEGSLIITLNIPNDIILSIVSYVGNGIIPIAYRLSYLPFFRAIREHSLYRKTLKQWWKEVISNKDHRGVFYPTSLKSAALEFQKFFTERLALNGVDDARHKRVKYQRYMVPKFAIEIEPGILQTDCCRDLGFSHDHSTPAVIGVSLPTASGSSACVGGIELFQRLYLETAIHPEYVDAFNVDLVNVDGNHGDNWCFDGNGNVMMADGTYTKISAVQIGDCVRTFPGNATAKVKCIIVSNIYKEIEMVELNNNCWITFEHPVLISNGEHDMSLDEDISNKLHSEIINQYHLRWVLPKDILPVQYKYQDKIYNFVLDRHHTLNVNGNWCCTLGHDYKGYIIEHEFWGNSTVIDKFLRTNSPTYPYVVFG